MYNENYGNDNSFSEKGIQDTHESWGFQEAQETQEIHYESPKEAALPKKNRRKGLAVKVIAACLACILVGGAAGAGVTMLLGDDGGPNVTHVQIGGKHKEDADSRATVNINTGLGSTTPATPATYTGATLTGNEIYDIGCRSVVGISTEILTENVFGQITTAAVSGTGFIISDDGYILTNHHVVDGASKVTVMLNNGDSYEATVVGYEEDNDVAVLKIKASDLAPVTFGISSDMSVGETVYAIGNPLGELTYTMTSGIVSALDREISTDDSTSINMFQIDAAINAGNSGGPVFNSKGEVIGIVTAKYADTGVEGLGFAVPSDDALEIAVELIEHGYVTGKPSFGIKVITVTESTAQYYNMVPGAYVQSVDQGSCAEAAGIKSGDIITQVGDEAIVSTAELKAARKAYKAGDTVDITVYRSGQYITLSVTFDEQLPDTAVSTPAPQIWPGAYPADNNGSND